MISNKDKPLVSVIIPVYNGAQFIAAALESAVRQTYDNLEIVVIDDGSIDGTLDILNHYATQDGRIRIVTQSNGGVAKARNRALAEARGEFIAPLDADDLWLPTKIERQMRRMLAAGDDCGFVYCWWSWIDEAGMVLDRSPRWNIEGSALETLILINFTGNASVPLFRKYCVVEAGGYNPALAKQNSGGCEDWEVVLRVAARHRMAVVPEILLGYRRRPGSMSTACDMMKRSQQLVMQGIRRLRPELKPALFRGSDNQFAMYLAGLSFWAGNLREAFRWGFRAGLRLPVLAAPYVVKMLLSRRRKAKRTQVMRPGERIDTSLVAEPLLPYDHILSPRQLPGRLLWAFAKPVLERGARVFKAVLEARMRREASPTTLGSPARKPRVLATACWHFPIYSQTFVYREVQALADGGFDVRFTYAGLASRRELPDDLVSLWPLRRRILYTESTAARDLRHYQRAMPGKVQGIARSIAKATGMAEDEVFRHRHFRHAFSFARFAEAWRPDYIHTYFFYESAVFGYVASELLGIPRGISCYADHMVDDYDLKFVRLHMVSCAVVVATSARIKRELEELAGRPLPNAIVKPNGVDARKFNASERAPSGPGRVFHGVAVNRIHAKKGVSYLVEAVKMLRDRGIRFDLQICGEYDSHDPEGSAYLERLQQFIAEHKLESEVIFLGRQTALQVRRHLCEKDIFLAPFVELANGDKDGIPTALLEAMAGGCSIVATDAGSMTEVIRDDVEGLLVPQCDSMALADAITRLIADDALRARLAHAALERVRSKFDVSVCEAIFHDRARAAIAASMGRR